MHHKLPASGELQHKATGLEEAACSHSRRAGAADALRDGGLVPTAPNCTERTPISNVQVGAGEGRGGGWESPVLKERGEWPEILCHLVVVCVKPSSGWWVGGLGFGVEGVWGRGLGMEAWPPGG